MFGKTLKDFYSYACFHYADKVAIIDGSRRYTYAELEEKGTRLSNSLLEVDLKTGDRFAQLMPNCAETVFSEYACNTIGLGRIPLGSYLKPEDMIFIMKEANVSALIYDDRFGKQVGQIKKALPDVKYLCRSESNTIPQGDYSVESLISKGSSAKVNLKISEDDIATIAFTGGTTGVPKGVVHTHHTRVAMVIMELIDFGIGRNEVYLAAAPLTHGAGSILVPVLLRGGCVVTMQGFNAKRFLELIEEEKVSSSFVVPTMIYGLLDVPDVRKYDTSSLRNIIYGAAAINPERLQEALQIFGPVFTQVFGLSEVPMAISALSREEHIIDKNQDVSSSRLASCGRPTLLTEVKLLDDDGKEVAQGDTGELVVKSPEVMKEYLNRPDLTDQTKKDGWLHTGDLVRKDERGYIYIVGRKKDMIVTGGFNIYPVEIENIISAHPAVAVTSVIGVPDPKWGEAIKAVVKLRPGQSVSEEELINLCKEKKGSIAAPKSVDFVDDIPVTGLGKPDKKAIREKYWANQTRRV